MRGSLFTVIVVVIVAVAPAAVAAPRANGALVESKPLVWPAYAQLGPIAKALVRERDFDAMVSDRSVELVRIKYASGGLEQIAIGCKPRDASARTPKPLVVYLHGGAGERSKIGAENFDNVVAIRRFCTAGFVVLAPQYRGVDGGGGRDEVGGRDVDDVIALVPLARNLGYVDTRRVFAWGFSRGAMMALQLVRANVPLGAVVVVGVAADFRYGVERFPDFAAEIPDDGKTPAGIERRSPIRWADKLTGVPLLLLHGADDPATPASDAAALAGKILAAGGLVEMHLYAREDHPISGRLDEVYTRSLDWFQNVRKRSAAVAFDATLRARGAKAAADRVRALRRSEPDRWDFGERALNRLGYTYLFQGQAATAVIAFELMVELYPRSANAWDSLGEGYEAAGRRADARRAYARSFALDPKNARAEQKVEALKR